jgi:hypothetical protein
MNKPSLTERRAELIARCAEQRTGLSFELNALRPSSLLDHPLAGYIAGNRKLVMGALGAGLGLTLLRRKRMLALAGSAMSAWRMAQRGLALLAQLRAGRQQ